LISAILKKNLKGLTFSEQYEKVKDLMEVMSFRVYNIYENEIGEDAWDFIKARREFNYVKEEFPKLAIKLTETPPVFDIEGISLTKKELSRKG
jgi:hypothetical protein